ncbi:MAG: 30S ribosomal protein S1 [Verrucomicrobia bacterium]|nr:30S ribosomal protein S1 [Verrucomicrobiota bacterium]
MTAMYEETLKDFTEGSIVVGKIIEIRKSDVLVDIGYKSEGLISLSEFRDADALKPGSSHEVLLESLEDDEGMVVLSRQRAELQRSWDRVLAEFNEGDTIKGEMRGRVKGGFIVDVGGVDAFLPGSQVDVVPVRNHDEYMNAPLDFKILKINQDRRNIVLSRRELLEDQRKEQKKVLLAEIQKGQVRKGFVKNITDFGAFIDLNGMDGLLHITDMSWGRINHPSEMLRVGQDVEVMILDVDLEKERISLGLKQKADNPWDTIEAKYPVGKRIRGKVVNLMPYGAFVELEQGVEGMVHVSEISWTKRVARASDVLSVGEEVDAVVLSVNKDEQKISLGIRQTEANPWDLVAERYPIGARIKGKVRNFTSYGAFVELEEGVDGMIHVSDMSWTRKVNHPSEVLNKGDEVEAIVLEVDASNQRISLGLKQAQEDPWAGVTAKYAVGQLVKGKVRKLTSFGAFVELEEGVDALVHISQISEQRVQNVRDVLKPGEEVEARIVKIDPVERRIGLSIKAAQISDEEFEVSEEMLQGLRPGEDLVDLAGAFDEAFGDTESSQEWHPGQS